MPDDSGRLGGDTATPPADDAILFAEGAFALWGNLLTLMSTHLLEQGTARSEILETLKLHHDTNEATIRSPRAKAVAARHLMAVYNALETSR